MSQHLYNRSAALATDYQSEDIKIIGLGREQHTDTTIGKDFSEYVCHANTTRDLATTMLNEAYLTETIDYPYANQYRQYIMDFYNNIDEKIEIIETYITEFTERGQKNTPESLQVASITEQKENILQNIRIFKVRASTVQTESQWTVLLEEYQRMMKKLSSYIQTVEELV